MTEQFPHELLEDVQELAGYRGWSEDIYRDFLALRRNELTEAEFKNRYQRQRAILTLDLTGFTMSAMHLGELESLLRILDAQRVCIPVLKDHGAGLIRCFADDMVGVFKDPNSAIDAAFEIHSRIELFNASSQASDNPTHCGIGIGYGQIFKIGPNLAQGDEMNRASKLGEDFARAKETLVTERTFEALQGRTDIRFSLQDSDDQLFPFYRAELG